MINKDEILEMVYEDLEEAKQLLSFRLAEKENTEVISDRLEKLFFMAEYTVQTIIHDIGEGANAEVFGYNDVGQIAKMKRITVDEEKTLTE
jgi:hypothetical protein